MPWTQADLANLDAAIATGAKVVRFQDRTVEYQSTDAMMAARTTINNFLNANNTPPITRQIRCFTEKGF